MAMTPDTPTWLDTCYVQNLLQKTENDESIKVSNITIKPATVKGDNYLSDMYRVSVDTLRVIDGLEIQNRRSLIVKVAPTDAIREEMISSAGVFEVEMLMMSNTLPKMSHFLTELGMTSLGARCLLVHQEKPMHLVFEDLSSRGFGMADRQAGLDLDHCSFALRNLGRFHASSIALKEKDSEAFASYRDGLFRENRPAALRGLFEAGVKALANETRNWPELSPRISEKLLKLSEVVWKKACVVAKFREDEFNVLVHGDYWLNNMMFRYDELRRPIEHIFVDFQICHQGSPVVDILYFLGTSLSNDVRMNHREKLLREYHDSLTSTMAKLKCNTEAPSFDNLKETLHRYAFLEAAITFVALPMMLVDKSEAQGLDELLTELNGEYVNPGYRGIAYRNIMSRLLPLYDSMGLLDD